MEIPNCRNKIDSHSGMIPSEVVQYGVVVKCHSVNGPRGMNGLV